MPGRPIDFFGKGQRQFGISAALSRSRYGNGRLAAGNKGRAFCRLVAGFGYECLLREPSAVSRFRPEFGRRGQWFKACRVAFAAAAF